MLSRAVARKSRSAVFGIPCIESDLVDLNLFIDGNLWLESVISHGHLKYLQKSTAGLRRKQMIFKEKHDLLVYLVFFAYFTNEWVSRKSCKHLQGYLQHYILKLLKELPISVLAANLPTGSGSSEYDQMSDKTSAEARKRRLQQLMPCCFQRLSKHLTKSNGRVSFDVVTIDVITESCAPIWRAIYLQFGHSTD